MTDQIDFVALAAQLTNEQKILATLVRIEKLLTPTAATLKPNPLTPKTVEAPTPKKGFGRK